MWRTAPDHLHFESHPNPSWVLGPTIQGIISGASRNQLRDIEDGLEGCRTSLAAEVVTVQLDAEEESRFVRAIPVDPFDVKASASSSADVVTWVASVPWRWRLDVIEAINGLLPD